MTAFVFLSRTTGTWIVAADIEEYGIVPGNTLERTLGRLVVDQDIRGGPKLSHVALLFRIGFQIQGSLAVGEGEVIARLDFTCFLRPGRFVEQITIRTQEQIGLDERWIKMNVDVFERRPDRVDFLQEQWVSFNQVCHHDAVFRHVGFAHAVEFRGAEHVGSVSRTFERVNENEVVQVFLIPGFEELPAVFNV